MVATQLIAYLRNNPYLPHLDLLLYFTPDDLNGDLVRRNLLLQPIMEPQQIPPLTNNLLHHTSHLLTQTHQKSLPDILLQLTYLGLHNNPHHYLVSTPALLCLGGAGGCRIRIWDTGVHGE